MDCKTSSDLMMSYMDQAITADEWENLQQHLDTCEHCREEFSIFSQIDDFFEDALSLEPQESFDKKVMESIDHSLYSSRKKALGLRELFFSIGIYITFLLGIQGVGRGLGNYQLSFFGIMERILLFSELFQKLMVGAFVLLVLYPRKMLQSLMAYLSHASVPMLLLYSTGLLTLLLLMFIIQGTLYRILTTRGDSRHE